MTTNAATFNRTFRRHHDLDALLPMVAHSVSSGIYASQNELARALSVDRATAHRWRKRAVAMGLIDERSWDGGFLRGRLARLMQAPSPTVAAA